MKDAIDLSKLGESCANCKYCKAQKAADASLVMICKRYPPTLVGGPVPVQGGVVVYSESQFLVIAAPRDSWCGEWAASLQ